MDTKIELWTISQIYEVIDTINEQPSYQRGGVWKDAKKSLLIDSILRGIDMPKVFLNKLKTLAFDYEVADGQQRLDAIIKFRNGKLKLREDKILGLDLNLIGNSTVGGLNYDELPKRLRDRFDNYVVTIAILENATKDEVRTLFGRLQLGETLKPAEKRNAIISLVGNHINSIAINHSFFTNSKIKKERFNRQDYLAHAFALVSYNNSSDLTAELIQKMYLDESLTWSQKSIKKITSILDDMQAIDSCSKKRIVNKFAFLDIFWLLFSEYENYDRIDYKSFGRQYDEFEELRLQNNSNLEELSSSANKSDKDLHKYIMAFRFEGSKVGNINNRTSVIKSIFNKSLK